ncbi:MAG: sugar phosphate isomerase/epimerase [Clostridiales bacterium]|nr:sugar phosphate isomerase/epimerase [Clostridiales bacterium]
MKLSVSTCAFNGLAKEPDGFIYACEKSKFRNMDINLSFVSQNDDYQKDAEKIIEASDKTKVKFTMAHAPFKFNPFFSDEHFNIQVEDVKKAIITADMLGIDRLTVHAGSSLCVDKQDLMHKNKAYYLKLLEYAEKYNIFIMVENISEKIRNRPFDVQTADDILWLKELVNYHPLLKACWDTGHANTLNLDQYSNIKKLEGMLMGIHLQDNNGDNDDHMIPLLGTVNFDEVIKGLKDINYSGPFNFEVHVFNNGNTWPNYRRPFTESSGAEKLLFDPDDELRYLGVETLHKVALYIAKKHDLKFN